MLTYNADIKFDVTEYFDDRYEEVKAAATPTYSTRWSGSYTGGHGQQSTMGFQVGAGNLRRNPNAPGVSNQKDETDTKTLGAETLMHYPADSILEMFGIIDDYKERQTVLKKVYNLNPKYNDHRLISKVIAAREEVWKRSNPTERAAMVEQISDVLIKSIVAVYKLDTYEDDILNVIISAIGEQLVTTTDAFVPKDDDNAFHTAVRDSVDALAYMSQLEVE